VFKLQSILGFMLTLTCRHLCSSHYSDHFKRKHKQTHQQEKKEKVIIISNIHVL